MPSPSWEILDDFLDPVDFALSVTIQPQDGAARTVNGIFDDAYLNAEMNEYDMDTAKPRLLCKETDLVGVDRHDKVTIDGKLYNVLTIPQSTGDGMAVLSLALV